MMDRIIRFFKNWTLVQRFTIVSLVIMILGALGVGWWSGEEIKKGVINESAVNAALYLDSFVTPNLQGLYTAEELSDTQTDALNNLLLDTDLGKRIVAFKVWDEHGRVLYSIGPSLFTDIFPNRLDQARVWNGEVVAEISDLAVEKNLEMKIFNSRLLQIYSPVRLGGTGEVIAIIEFYQKVDVLNAEIYAAQQRSWLLVGTVMMVIYLLLVGFVQRAGNTIGRQETELTRQVSQLKELLAQNDELHQRVQRAAANTTAYNERFLRRISAELHDGPTQELGLAILRLDKVAAKITNISPGNAEELSMIQSALQDALQEMRAIALGFGLPNLDKYTLAETITRAVRAHERRTGTKVQMEVGELHEPAELPLKITVFRLIQEALNNAHRHAAGMGQKVTVQCEASHLGVQISDEGPGFDLSKPIDWENHMGLAGMRERVESLGGQFQIKSGGKRGTQIIAYLNLQSTGVE